MSSFKIPSSKYTFQVVPEYFVYTNPTIDNDTLPAYAERFGLESAKTWKGVLEDLERLNRNNLKESYKLIFAARHGQGFHNVAEEKYGFDEWETKWCLVKGDDELVWGPDATLTNLGESQARDANEKWKKELSSSDHVPLPTMFFSSPMVRSARTLELTYNDIVWPASDTSTSNPNGPRPHILECLREDFRDRHTCDERSKKSQIESLWKPLGWNIDPIMDEEDTIFASEYRETQEIMTQRLEDALSFVWKLADGHNVINITSHHEVMRAIFRVINHIDFRPKTGGIVPLLIRATEKGENAEYLH